MQNFDMIQLAHVHAKITEVEFDYVEMQARMVWAIANGWKKPVPVEEAMGVFDKMGALVDG